MKQHPRLIEVLQRSENGPILDEADFERKLVGPTIKSLVEKYAVQYSSESYINQDDDLADKLRLMRSHGMTSLSWDRHKGHAHSYDVVDLGYNYRIDEIRSAIGLVQLAKLEANNQRRREIVALYQAQLGEIDGLSIPYRDHPGISAAHLFPIILDNSMDRAVFIDSMKEKGIQTSIHYPPIHTFSYYRQTFGDIELPLTEAIGAREVTLPLFPTMSDEQVGWVVQAAKESMESNRG